MESRGNRLIVLVAVVVLDLLTGKKHDDEDEDNWWRRNLDYVPKRLIKRLNICYDTREHLLARRNTRSAETNPLATAASRQAAHSNAEPRASSKNLARWRPCRLPFPSCRIEKQQRGSRGRVVRSTRVDVVPPISKHRQERRQSKQRSRVRRNKHQVFRGQRRGSIKQIKHFIKMYVKMKMVRF